MSSEHPKRPVELHFDWDAAASALNDLTHGVDFAIAASVFLDPLSLTVRDSLYGSGAEERWVTIGLTSARALIVLMHTFRESSAREAFIRIISAKLATESERRQYERAHYSINEGSSMQNEYDFSGGSRGKFFRENAVLELPVYLEPKVLSYFTARARRKGLPLEALLNNVLRTEMEREKAAASG